METIVPESFLFFIFFKTRLKNSILNISLIVAKLQNISGEKKENYKEMT